ncbi:hypothetical protein [Alcanivorax sp. 1008]|uniref:hypothetical protein n=1 Tax=Alcanivorax sp. 1008 TaxID=2816853 RepID=UPI001DCBB2D1|nr:hypothetical protein [Alcanivorax sp. 1008]MCC1496067.1 hypothetical protein [Alcanivorax sp. 1008]
MKFWLILLILGWRMRWLAWRNEEFRSKLAGKDMVMQWRTRVGPPARSFHFLPDRIIPRHGLHPTPTVTLSFEDASYAVDTLMQAGKNQMVFMQGMQEGKIKIEGDASQLMWFMTLMKYLAPKKKK